MREIPKRLDQYQLVALHVAVNDKLMACGHFYAVGKGHVVSSYGAMDLLDMGLIRSAGQTSVAGTRGRMWTGEVFEPTEDGARMLPGFMERGPSDCGSNHWADILEVL